MKTGYVPVRELSIKKAGLQNVAREATIQSSPGDKMGASDEEQMPFYII